uniref:Uncharacterized protein n=1 Tax=Haemonchus contortus TaxID=6289 RepID=A0A7I4YP66_HAECO
MKGLAVVVAVMSLALAQPPRMPKGLPPGFKEALPADVVRKLEQIHENTSLTPEQQFDQIDKIMSALPPSVLAKLPPPPFLSQLPADARAKVEAVHRDTSLSWKQRHEKIRAIIEALPENLRPRPPGGPHGPHGPPPPGELPPGFEEVLPEDVVEQFHTIRDSTALTEEQKREKSDKIFSSLPAQIVDKLPWPPHFEDLPKDTLEKIKQIRSDTSLPWGERLHKIFSVIDALPENLRPPPPPFHRGPRGGRLPPGFKEALPKEIVEKVNAIQENKDLTNKQKEEKVDEILSSLTVEEIDKLPLPPFFKDLPKDIYDKVMQLRSDTSMPWKERHRKIFAIIDSLPEHLRPRPPFHRGPRGGRLPPGFKEALPKDIAEKVNAIQENKDLSDKQKDEKVDEILSSLSVEEIDKLPLPPFFKDLPKDTYEKVMKLRSDTSMPWKERHRKIFAIIDSLPEDQRPRLPFHRGPRGGRLPPGFKEALPKDIAEKVTAIQENKDLSDKQKDDKVDEILSSLSAEEIGKLPLPRCFKDLPKDTYDKVMQLRSDTSMSWKERHQKIFDIIDSLPEDQRPRHRHRPHPPPPPPPTLKQGKETKTFGKLEDQK